MFFALSAGAAILLFPLVQTFIKSLPARSYLDLAFSAVDLPALFPRYVVNSVLVAAVVTVLQLWFATPAAYALAKVRFPGANFLNRLVEAGLLFGGTALVVSQYVVLNRTGLINSYSALILPAVSTSLGVFLLRQFVRQIPDEQIDAARLDGASHAKMCSFVILPQIRPARVTAGVFAINSIWQFGGFKFVYSEEMKLIPAALERLTPETGAAYAAAVILMAVPMVIFAFSGKNIAETVTYCGLK
jgi:ABC-type glycerol-3-phosphate transport system permease component